MGLSSMENNQLIEEKECVVCNNSFFRRTKSRVRNKNRVNVRKVGSVTCSKQCARKRIKGEKYES